LADVVNLRAARKRAKRRQDDLLAGANRAVHGKPKSERELDAARRAKASRDLEKHRMERGDGR
jgi:hypothetical protein